MGQVVLERIPASSLNVHPAAVFLLQGKDAAGVLILTITLIM